MTLREWLNKEDLTAEAFAARIGASRDAVNSWCAGRRKPRSRFVAKVSEATNGQVTANDFYEAEAA